MAGYVTVDAVSRVSTASWESIERATGLAQAKLNSAIQITNITTAGGRTILYVVIENVGKTKIVRDDFSAIDVLVTYTNQNGISQTYWCYFNSLDSTKIRWNLNSTIYPNPWPAVVNPLDWNPSDSLAIVVQLPAQSQMRQNAAGYVEVVLPTGASAGGSFVANY
jgi:hypothetical protein